jgi:K+-transporting ATPase ATPase C chain
MFLKQLRIALLSMVSLTILTGIVYPAIVTAIANMCFPWQAKGSLITVDGQSMGSAVIGQNFDDPKYFWGRLSATTPPYNASSSSGSNLGPLNPALVTAVQGRIDALKKADPANTAAIPVDLVTASASGLDPDITPAAAIYQAARIAKVRSLSEEKIQSLIQDQIQGRWAGLFGEPRVNVLQLNRKLDQLHVSTT